MLWAKRVSNSDQSCNKSEEFFHWISFLYDSHTSVIVLNLQTADMIFHSNMSWMKISTTSAFCHFPEHISHQTVRKPGRDIGVGSYDSGPLCLMDRMVWTSSFSFCYLIPLCINVASSSSFLEFQVIILVLLEILKCLSAIPSCKKNKKTKNTKLIPLFYGDGKEKSKCQNPFNSTASKTKKRNNY